MLSPSKNADLAERLKTALALIASLLILVAFAIYSTPGKMVFSLVVLALICIAAFEFCKFPKDQAKGLSVPRTGMLILPSFAVAVCQAIFGFAFSAGQLLALVLCMTIIVQALALFSYCTRLSQSELLRELLVTFARDQIGFLLIGLGGACAVALSYLSPGSALILVAIVSVSDSAAYFAGRAYGVRKIAPLISPKKTVIGTVAGILAGVLLALLIKLLIVSNWNLSWAFTIAASFAIVICSQAGDFAKSILKRYWDIKDFGQIFPGHGGVLDRLDGILGAAPLALALLVLLCSC